MKKRNSHLPMMCMGIVAILLLGACDKKEEPVAKAELFEKVETVEPATSIEEVQEAVPEEVRVSESEDLYMSFLNDEVKVVVPEASFAKQTESTYTYTELNEMLRSSMESDWNLGMITEASYALIDCGKDGEPELALKVEFTGADDMWGGLTQYLVIKNMEGELKTLTAPQTFYRTETNINEYGYYTTGGSSGASSYGFDAYMIQGSGEVTYVYGWYTEMALSEPKIPSYNAVGGMDSDPDKAMFFSGFDYVEDGFVADRVNFSKLNTENYEEEIETYNLNNLFAFSDMNGESVMPSEECMGFYDQNGYQVMSEEDLASRVKNRETEVGLTEEIKNGADIGWIGINPIVE